jgi:hypothetical protein
MNISRILRRVLFALLALIVVALPSRAQTPPAQTAVVEPPLRRWFEIQSFTLSTRYRIIDNSKDVRTSNQLQYKDSFRARVNLDADKRYTINIGYFSGSSFTSSWNNWGVGNKTLFDGKNNYLKQLYGSATPVKGLEFQAGGLYLNKGDADELVTYDDDGFIVGERVSVRRPTELYLDELSVTRAQFARLNAPDLTSRWDGFEHPDYTQVIGLKKFSRLVTGSLGYEREQGKDIYRGAVTLHFDKGAPIDTLRYEQYRRTNLHPAAGFGVWADRPVTKYARVQGGYISVDQFYGSLNADRMFTGRRFFIVGTFPVYGPISASVYATKALDDVYTVAIARRFDAVITYDVLHSLRRTGIF